MFDSAKLYNIKLFNENIETLLYELLEKDGLIDDYSLMGDYYTDRSELFIKPLISNENLDGVLLKLRQIYGKTKFDILIVTDTLFGEFVFRRFDNTYSDPYKILVKNYNLKQDKKIDYFNL